MTYPKFTNDIVRMNGVYDLKPLDLKDEEAITKRLAQFKDILDKEFVELTDVQVAADGWRFAQTEDAFNAICAEVRVAMADLLGDIIVYCASEAERWQIPLADVLKIIMASNFSKLGEDGKPIKDANDKFQKGPNYWKPEPLIGKLLAGDFTGIAGTIIPFEELVINLNMDAVTAAATKEQP